MIATRSRPTDGRDHGAEMRPLFDALDRLSPVAAGTAAAAKAELSVSLQPLLRSNLGPRVWSASRLTARGFPVELAVTSASPELRTVVEVVPPEADRSQALPVALELAARFGSDGWCQLTEHLLIKHQQSFVPRFGAWLGSRHCNPVPSRSAGQAASHGSRHNSSHGSRHKVYVEVSPDQGKVWQLLDHLAPEARHVVGGLAPIRFIGMRLDRPDALEIYLRPPRVKVDRFRMCLVRAGLTKRADAVIQAMGTETDDGSRRPIDGLSLSLDRNQVTAVAGFTFAHRRHGSDQDVKQAMTARATDERWPSADIYAALAEPIAEQPSPFQGRSFRPTSPPFHTVLSEVASVDSTSVEHHIGLAPPLPIDKPNYPLGAQ